MTPSFEHELFARRARALPAPKLPEWSAIVADAQARPTPRRARRGGTLFPAPAMAAMAAAACVAGLSISAARSTDRGREPAVGIVAEAPAGAVASDEALACAPESPAPPTRPALERSAAGPRAAALFASYEPKREAACVDTSLAAPACTIAGP